MGLLRRVRSENYKQDGTWLSEALGVQESDSGIAISERSAMRVSTVYKCVDWRARMYGSIPKVWSENTVRNKRPTRQAAIKHPLYPLFLKAPNSTMTAFEMGMFLSADLHLWGNSYWLVVRGKQSGRIASLWRIRPDLVRPHVVPGTSRIIYYVTYSITQLVDSQLITEAPFEASEIWHVRGLGFDGVKGYSPIRMHMNAIGWNVAAVRYGAQFLKNAGRPSFAVISKNVIADEEQKSALVSALTKSGKNAGQGMLVEGDVDFKPLSMQQDEAQFIETIEYQETDICGIMGVKAHEVGILKGMTTTTAVEQETISSITRCLSPLSIMIEQSASLHLLSDMPSTGLGGSSEFDRFFLYSDLSSLQRGDTAAQTKYLQTLIEKSVWSPNDALEFLGQPTFDGGDTHVYNRAYAPFDMIQELALQPPATGAPSGNDPREGEKSQPADRLKKVLYSSLYSICRDAIGRTTNRKSDRSGFATVAFGPILDAVCKLSDTERNPKFTSEYLNFLSHRAANWTSVEDLDVLAANELNRMILVFTEEENGR